VGLAAYDVGVAWPQVAPAAAADDVAHRLAALFVHPVAASPSVATTEATMAANNSRSHRPMATVAVAAVVVVVVIDVAAAAARFALLLLVDNVAALLATELSAT